MHPRGAILLTRSCFMKTRTLIILTMLAGLAILVAFTLQITLAAR